MPTQVHAIVAKALLEGAPQMGTGGVVWNNGTQDKFPNQFAAKVTDTDEDRVEYLEMSFFYHMNCPNTPLRLQLSYPEVILRLKGVPSEFHVQANCTMKTPLIGKSVLQEKRKEEVPRPFRPILQPFPACASYPSEKSRPIEDIGTYSSTFETSLHYSTRYDQWIGSSQRKKPKVQAWTCPVSTIFKSSLRDHEHNNNNQPRSPGSAHQRFSRDYYRFAPTKITKETTGKKPYKKEMKATYTFPSTHAYSGMSKAQLIDELKRKQAARRDVKVHTWHTKDAMMCALLKDDGVDVPVVLSARPSKRVNDEAGAEDDGLDGDEEMQDADYESEAGDGDEEMQDAV
ncbi:uncharacterized protein LY89DRAFT_669437 [Mollisia scopiformis]|uniref:Uncharacterized protein n=1 Tax=Mollisia scopiformis TaxID=149040 RepID=A0A194XA11_MOLSC|nr:uncharacterized protein LY89DRAFT_669437 [Mollisia scopiformis]KUJ17003.1 hypothetical protein LY89DRAFT_669437 [Mollisia scopiformis]